MDITSEQETELKRELESTIKRILSNFGPKLEAETYIYNEEGELISVIAF